MALEMAKLDSMSKNYSSKKSPSPKMENSGGRVVLKKDSSLQF